MLARIEPDLLPRLSGVGRFVDAVAMMRHHTADSVFTHADVNDIRITLGNGDRAHRARLEKAIGDIAPAQTHILGLPETATGRSHVISLRITDHPGTAYRSSTTKRSNRSPLQRFENVV